jgi:hypothetical protein
MCVRTHRAVKMIFGNRLKRAPLLRQPPEAASRRLRANKFFTPSGSVSRNAAATGRTPVFATFKILCSISGLFVLVLTAASP